MSDTHTGSKEKNVREKRSGCLKFKRTNCSTAKKKKSGSERSNNTSGTCLIVLDTALQNKIGELLIP